MSELYQSVCWSDFLEWKVWPIYLFWILFCWQSPILRNNTWIMVRLAFFVPVAVSNTAGVKKIYGFFPLVVASKFLSLESMSRKYCLIFILKVHKNVMQISVWLKVDSGLPTCIWSLFAFQKSWRQLWCQY